jgi:hypothetical protein
MELKSTKLGLVNYWTPTLHGKKAQDLVPQSLIASYLHKESGFYSKTWERRFVLLMPTQLLLYFESPEDTEPRGMVLLSQDSTLDQIGDLHGRHNAFAIHAVPTEDAARVLHLSADSPDESRAWCEALFTNRADVLRAEKSALLESKAKAATQIAALEGELAATKSLLASTQRSLDEADAKGAVARRGLEDSLASSRKQGQACSNAVKALLEQLRTVAAEVARGLAGTSAGSADSERGPFDACRRSLAEMSVQMARLAAGLEWPVAEAAVGADVSAGLQKAADAAVQATPALKAWHTLRTAASEEHSRVVALQAQAVANSEHQTVLEARLQSQRQEQLARDAEFASAQAAWREKETKFAGLFTQVNERLKGERERTKALDDAVQALQAQLRAATAAAAEARALAARALDHKAETDLKVEGSAGRSQGAATGEVDSAVPSGGEPSQVADAAAAAARPPLAHLAHVRDSGLSSEASVGAAGASARGAGAAAAATSTGDGPQRTRASSFSDSFHSLMGTHPRPHVVESLMPGTPGVGSMGSAVQISPQDLALVRDTDPAKGPASSGAAPTGAMLPGPFNILADPHPGRLYVLVMGCRNLPAAGFGSFGSKSAYIKLHSPDQPERLTRSVEVLDKGPGRGMCATFHQCLVVKVTRALEALPLRLEAFAPRTMRSDVKLGGCTLDVSALGEWPRQSHAVWMMLQGEAKAGQADPIELPVPVRANAVLGAHGPAPLAAAAGKAGATTSLDAAAITSEPGNAAGDATRWAMPELPPPPLDGPSLLVQCIYAPSGADCPLAFFLPPTGPAPVAGSGGPGIAGAGAPLASPAPAAGSAVVGRPIVPSGSKPELLGSDGVGTAAAGAAPTPAGSTPDALEGEPLVQSLRQALADQKQKLDRLARAYKELLREKAALEAEIASLRADCERLRPPGGR